mgnify:FL=1
MSKKIKVNYFFRNSRDGFAQSTQLLGLEPISFIKYFSTKRESSAYLKCPAFLEYFKNTFVIFSPYTLDINIDRTRPWCSINSIPQDVFNEFVEFRTHQFGINDPVILTLPPKIVFYSNEEVTIESIPLFLDRSEYGKNLRVIPGSFRIDKWVRPVDFTCEILDDRKNILIKRDDPIFCVRFTNPDNWDINLERVLPSEDLEKLSHECVSLKFYMKNLGLKQLYKLSENYLKLLGKK